VFERIFDNRLFRIIVGTAIGLPLSALALVAALEAILLSLGGFMSADPEVAVLVQLQYLECSV
jgi:hypothetical protein